MAKIFIDNQEYRVQDGQNLLQASLSLKLDLPYFCWHPAMGSVGACRQCAMTQYQDENDTRGRMIVACMTPVSEGMRVSMQQPAEKEFREQNIAALMTHHPHDCPVCAEGGECHLQDMTVMTGHHERHYKGKKTTFVNQDLGPLIKHEMNRCITCYRCERFYKDYAGGSDLAAQASSNKVYFGRQSDGTLQSEFAGNLVEVCPTGVFTDKPFGDHYSRKWDLQTAPSVCQHCSIGCNTSLSERYGSVRRVTNRFNEHLNGYFLCDRGRYGFSYVNNEARRLTITLDGQQSIWAETALKVRLKNTNKWIGIGSSQASLEDNFALQQLVGRENFNPGLDAQQETLLSTHMAILNQWQAPSLAQMEQADAIVILAEDVNNSAPRIALSLRQALLNNAREQAEKLRVPSWQDAAVRAIKPNHPVPLAIYGYGENDLTKQATIHLVCTPKQAAEQGFLLANLLINRAPKPKVSKVAPQTLKLLEILKVAKRPLIVAGWSANHPALLAAASNIRNALKMHKTGSDHIQDDAMLCIVPPEANTLGLGLLTQGGYLSVDDLNGENKHLEKTNLLVLDHTTPAFANRLDVWRQSTDNLVRLSQLGTPRIDEINLPVSSFSECSGSELNYQGLIQSHLPATKPSGQCLPSWQWLVNIARLRQHTLGKVDNLGQLRDLLNQEHPQLSAHFNQHNQTPMALQTPRTSGRTAMLANQTVHEPKPFIEIGAPYKHSMEGIQAGQSKDFPMAYSWSPGWNSNQSNHKFRDEYRGAELRQQEGVLCIGAKHNDQWFKWQTPWSKSSKAQWQILPLQKVFGSDNLSLHALPIAQLKVQAQIVLRPEDAEKLNFSVGQLIYCDDKSTPLELTISHSVPKSCVVVYVPADQLFEISQCDQLTAATSKQTSTYKTHLLQQQAEQVTNKQQQRDRLLTQDQTIPIHFIEGVS
ncbi:NADH-quinone oxidoreductase subunit NuoG [uncultured Paraglaciecola sp.]|uniref:NADH-quinone oxidoreductase subunit NuoG n=1 Tax=uncultured Paraglaciecola sp. TaxID=1765024 RepID=UPI0030DDC778|tara:strand:- start:181517 stop:184309 length:2793 start_codon:yes stop_codon:yes gene_type:complete